MKKILILKINSSDMRLRKKENCDIENYYICTVKNFIFRVLKKINLSIVNIFFGKWKKHIKNYDRIILFDNGYSKAVTKYIKSKNKNCKIILWFWNPIIEYSKSYLLDQNIDEVWTYDKNDSKKYNLNYNTQFYNKEIICKNSEIKQDIIFLGKEKGRRSIIESFDKQFNNNGVKTKIMIIENEKNLISYDKYLEYVGESNAILDIILGDVIGLTLRCMESLFFNKKLITNNLDIQNYDFYNPKNIFILGKDDIHNIKEFIKTPYEQIDDKIINYYDFEQWLERFGE